MSGDVVRAVKENAKPWETDEEDTIIVLSAFQKDELIAIRCILQSAAMAATATYNDDDNDDKDRKQKTVVLVNCHFDLLPRELSTAKTVYSIVPLVAKTSSSVNNVFSPRNNQRRPPPQDEAQQEQQPVVKAVVLRQYPNDWQVFVDDGSRGIFEPASSTTTNTATRQPAPLLSQTKGPPMQWVSTCIKNFLQSRRR